MVDLYYFDSRLLLFIEKNYQNVHHTKFDANLYNIFITIFFLQYKFYNLIHIVTLNQTLL